MRWKTNGIRVVKQNELDARTAQTLGMHRKAAVTTEPHGRNQALGGGSTTSTPE